MEDLKITDVGISKVPLFVSTRFVLFITFSVEGCSGSGSGWWVDDCWLVTGVIFVVAVSIRRMKSLGVRAQTVADCPQKLKTGVGAVRYMTLSARHSGCEQLMIYGRHYFEGGVEVYLLAWHL